jgi:hypothetical protein
MKIQNKLDYHQTTAADQKGSARVSRAGLKAWPLLRIRCSGVAPKQSSAEFSIWYETSAYKKSLRSRDAFANTPEACATQRPSGFPL